MRFGPCQVLQRRIMAAMPDGSTRTSAWSAVGSLQKLQALSESTLARLGTRSVQGQLAACMAILACVVQARGPNVERALSSGGFLGTFIGLLANFCRHDCPHPTSQGQAVTLHGKDALLAKYEAVVHTRKRQDHLEPSHMFHRMLTRQHMGHSETLTASVLGTKSVVATCRLKTKTAPEDANAATADARAKRAKKAAAHADTNTLFE